MACRYAKLLVRHERELREQAEAAIERALRLQAAEYERRLDDLNHAHAQAVQTQATFLPRELFDEYTKAATLWKDEVKTEMAVQRTRPAQP